jgi:hypothetical protein
VSVSGTPSGEDESFEIRSEPTQPDLRNEWRQTTGALWNPYFASVDCELRSPTDQDSNFINRFYINLTEFKGTPPLSLDEKGAGYEIVDIEYRTEDDLDAWHCTGRKSDAIGQIAIEIESLTPSSTSVPQGSSVGALITGSFEATYPPVSTFDPAITPITIKGSWMTEEDGS